MAVRIAEVARHPIRGYCSGFEDRKSTRLNSSHVRISYAVFCLKKKRRHSRPAPQAGPPVSPVDRGGEQRRGRGPQGHHVGDGPALARRADRGDSYPGPGRRRGGRRRARASAGPEAHQGGRGDLFFFSDPATTEIYTLSLHDALPISLTGSTSEQSFECWRTHRKKASMEGFPF